MFADSEVELISHMPQQPDLAVVNAARVSYGTRKTILDEKDIKLIYYLAKHEHTSPFRHIQYTFRIKAPEFVARQLYKHCIGCNYTSQQSFSDHAWNEISGRYTEYKEEFWKPNVWRQQSKSNKQVGDIPIYQQYPATELYDEAITSAWTSYKNLLNLGVCKEQARAVLPVSFFTEWYWTASFQAVAHMITLRMHTGAQQETQQIALMIADHIKQTAPYSYSAMINKEEYVDGHTLQNTYKG